MSEQWPLPQASVRPALPSVEDLPRNGDGYEPDSVQEAFDAFYRQLLAARWSLKSHCGGLSQGQNLSTLTR